MEDFVAMQIGDSLDELGEDAFDFGESKPDFHLEEAGEVVVHIFEDKESRPPVHVAAVGPRDDDLLEFNNMGMINLLQQRNL